MAKMLDPSKESFFSDVLELIYDSLDSKYVITNPKATISGKGVSSFSIKFRRKNAKDIKKLDLRKQVIESAKRDGFNFKSSKVEILR